MKILLHLGAQSRKYAILITPWDATRERTILVHWIVGRLIV